MSASPPLRTRASHTSSRAPARPMGRHIPRFFVRPAAGQAGASGVGAHRFPRAPTPVLGASLTLLGLPAVDAACRPFARAPTYGCARITPAHPSGERPRQLRSARLPKV